MNIIGLIIRAFIVAVGLMFFFTAVTADLHGTSGGILTLVMILAGAGLCVVGLGLDS